MEAVCHISFLKRFFNFNFRPIVNNNSITPISDIAWTVELSCPSTKPEKFITKPAIKKPTSGGKPIFLANNPKMKAIVSQIASI